MAHLVNPISLRLNHSRYWNNCWCVNRSINYAYINMLDFYILKFLLFTWEKLKWYRKGLILMDFKIFRIKSKVILNLSYQDQKVLKILQAHEVHVKGLKRTLRHRQRRPHWYKFRKLILFNMLNQKFFTYFKYYLLWSIRKFLCKIDVEVNLILLASSCINAAFIASVIRMKLIQEFPFKWLMRFMVKNLVKLCWAKYLLGFKLLLSGRFSRRDRSSYYWKIRGRLPLNAVGGRIDYSLKKVYLLNSVCGIKVWLNIRKLKRKILIF